jgi:hypothetical protein
MLLEDFYSENPLIDRWAIGDRLYTIRFPKYINDYLKIIGNPNYGIDRQMLVLLVGRIKVDKAIPILISLLDDDTVLGHALKALSEYKNAGLKPYFERFIDYKNPWIRKTAVKARHELD